MNRYKAILWDVGGTLVDYRWSLGEAVRECLDACQVSHHHISDALIESTYTIFYGDERSWRVERDEWEATRRWAEKLLSDPKVSAAQLDRAADSLMGYYGMYKPVEGMVGLLVEMRERGLRQGIVSNWPPSLPRFLDHHGLTEWFDVIVYSAEDGVHKPQEGIFRRALGRLGVMSEEAIFIGDNPECDIEPARKMGMTAIHFDPRRRHGGRDAEIVPQLRTLLSNLF